MATRTKKVAQTETLPPKPKDNGQQQGFPGIQVETKFVVAEEVRNYLDGLSLAEAKDKTGKQVAEALRAKFPDRGDKIDDGNVSIAVGKWKKSKGVDRKSLKAGGGAAELRGDTASIVGLASGATMRAVPQEQAVMAMVLETIKARKRLLEAIEANFGSVHEFRATLDKIAEIEKVVPNRQIMMALLDV